MENKVTNVEISKELSEFPEYKFYTDGQVYSYWRNRFLIPAISAQGYYRLYLYNKQGEKKRFTLHRLIATLFIENPNNYKLVNHINGNKLDNRMVNLEWCTALYNTQHAFKSGLLNNFEPKPIKQLSTTDKFIAEYRSIREACRKTGIDYRLISLTCRGYREQTGGYRFEFI